MKTRWTSGLLGLSMGLALYATVPAFALERLRRSTAPHGVQVPDLQTDGTVIDQCVKTKERQAIPSSMSRVIFSTSLRGLPKDAAPREAPWPRRSAATASVAPGRHRSRSRATKKPRIRLFLHVHREFIHFPVALDTQREAKEAYRVKTSDRLSAGRARSRDLRVERGHDARRGHGQDRSARGAAVRIQ